MGSSTWEWAEKFAALTYKAASALNLDFALGNQRVEGMSRDGDRLYVTALDIAGNQCVLRTIDITATGLTARGSVVLPGVTTTGDPYVVDGRDSQRRGRHSRTASLWPRGFRPAIDW